ncbi:MAG: hypothetical protein SVY15_05210 [Halobacteriota archaeon]|nr:hypothetical protein [Halobacteriota archaeon]
MGYEFNDSMEDDELAMNVQESERAFIGVCDSCGLDILEGDSISCPNCGALYHELCVGSSCTRCDVEMSSEHDR